MLCFMDKLNAYSEESKFTKIEADVILLDT